MSVRDDPVLFLRGGKGGNAFGTVAGGNATTTAVTHRLDGPEHAAADDTTRLDATADEHGLLPKLSGDPDDVLGGDGAWANRLARLRAISPTTLAANTDNWAPTGLSTADVIRVATDASRNLTGITAPAVGRALLLLNVGSFDLVLKDDVTSTAANRFFLPYGDVTLVPDAGAELWYDVTTARWRIVAVVTSAGASFGTPAVTYGTPAAGAASTAIRTDAVLPAPNKVVLTLTNKVGSSVSAGDVVKVNTGTDESFNSTTTGQAEVSIGIVQETIADNASGRVLVSGYAALVNVPASVTRGHYVETHTVAKQAVGNSSRRAGSFGQFLTGGTTPSAILWGQTDQTASAGVSFATPAIALGTAAAAGAASTVIRSDATIVAFDATVPVTQAFSDAAATGSAAFAARRDHKHGMPASPGGGGALVLLEQHTASSSATLDFLTGITSTYDDYILELLGLVPATNTANLLLTASHDGGSTWLGGTSYNVVYQFSKLSAVSTGSVATGSSVAWSISQANASTAAGGVTGTVRVYDPLGGVRDTNIIFDLTQLNSGDANFYNYHGAGYYAATTTLNALRIAFSAGNIASGIARLYGIAKT